MGGNLGERRRQNAKRLAHTATPAKRKLADTMYHGSPAPAAKNASANATTTHPRATQVRHVTRRHGGGRSRRQRVREDAPGRGFNVVQFTRDDDAVERRAEIEPGKVPDRPGDAPRVVRSGARNHADWSLRRKPLVAGALGKVQEKGQRLVCRHEVGFIRLDVEKN